MYNKSILIGRFTADPELKQTQSGVSVCSFRLAVNRAYQPKGGEREADFINIAAWRQTAEFVSRYFRKGSLILVEGPIQTREYTDRDGNKRTAVEVSAEHVSFVESRKDSEAAPTQSGDSGFEGIRDSRYEQPVRPGGGSIPGAANWGGAAKLEEGISGDGYEQPVRPGGGSIPGEEDLPF